MSIRIEQGITVGRRSPVATAESPPGPRSARGGPEVDAWLRERFTRLTHLLYDTQVPLDVLEREVIPLLSPDIEFLDPWVHIRGRDVFRAGLRGFHCVIDFDFDIRQVAVQRDFGGERARVIVDGTMHLRQLQVYTYPLRTTLVFDARLADDARSFEIERLDEMWSLGDLFANVPVAGGLYDAGRRAWGRFFTGAFRLGCAIATRLRPDLEGSRERAVTGT